MKTKFCFAFTDIYLSWLFKRNYSLLYCNVLQCTALYCNVLQCTALYCNVLQCTAMYCNVLQCTASGYKNEVL